MKNKYLLTSIFVSSFVFCTNMIQPCQAMNDDDRESFRQQARAMSSKDLAKHMDLAKGIEEHAMDVGYDASELTRARNVLGRERERRDDVEKDAFDNAGPVGKIAYFVLSVLFGKA